MPGTVVYELVMLHAERVVCQFGVEEVGRKEKQRSFVGLKV